MVESAAKLGAVGLRAARHFLKHLPRSGGRQRADLRRNALAIRRDSGVAVDHPRIMTVTYAKESPFRINGLGFLHKS